MLQFDRSFFEELDGEKIVSLKKKAEPYFRYRHEMYSQYRRKVKDYEQMKALRDDNIPVPYEYYIVNMAQGYLSGKAPTYSVVGSPNSESYQVEIDQIRRYNDDPALFTEVIHDYMITSAGYLYITENENNEIEYVRLDSRSTIILYDYGTPPYPLAVMILKEGVNEDGDEIEMIEIITERSRRVFDDAGNPLPFEDYDESGNLVRMTEKPLYWNDVPITGFENPDSIAIFEPASGMIDMFENMLTNIRSMTHYNDHAKLMVSGYRPENPMFVAHLDPDGKQYKDPFGTPLRIVNPAWKQEEKELMEAPAIFLDEDGKMEWLIKEVNYDGILSVMDLLRKLIAMVTNVTNMTDESFSGNASGVALGFKLYPLDQYAAVVDRVFKRGYLRLWELVTNRLNLKNGTNYDFRDIDVTFTRNVPTDRDKEIERAGLAKDKGLLSTESAINIAGLGVDPVGELERIAAERIQIKTPQDVIDLFTGGLVDEETALIMLFGEDKAQEIKGRLDEEKLARDAAELERLEAMRNTQQDDTQGTDTDTDTDTESMMEADA